MGLAVELFFDATAEQAIRAFRQSLTNAGIPPLLDTLGDRPHISLAGFPTDDATPLLAPLRTFAASTAPFVVTLSALEMFPTPEGVLFLAPAPTQTLLSVHRALHRMLAATSVASTSYYQPEQWVPHCTVATGLEPAHLAMALEVCLHAFTPLPVTFREVGLIQFRPSQPIQTFKLRTADDV